MSDLSHLQSTQTDALCILMLFTRNTSPLPVPIHASDPHQPLDDVSDYLHRSTMLSVRLPTRMIGSRMQNRMTLILT